LILDEVAEGVSMLVAHQRKAYKQAATAVNSSNKKQQTSNVHKRHTTNNTQQTTNNRQRTKHNIQQTTNNFVELATTRP